MWTEKNKALTRTFKFKDFKQAFAFMTEVAFIAEKMDHHPMWSNVYNEVAVHLSTHDAGDVITEKDRHLADAIDRVWWKYERAGM
jgi:4a-hydroxytetrahydrobiopterin dehydratase